MSKKYLKKNEFRYDTNPAVRRPDGRGHVVYVSAKQGHNAKINVITHAKTFFDEPTIKLQRNPNRMSTYKSPSRFSIPVWEKDKYLITPEKGYWRLDKRDRIAIKKANKKYAKRRK